MEQPSIQDLSAPTGEFLEPPPSEHPILSSGYELRPDLIAMGQELSFSGLDIEDPCHHLRWHSMNTLAQTLADGGMGFRYLTQRRKAPEP